MAASSSLYPDKCNFVMPYIFDNEQFNGLVIVPFFPCFQYCEMLYVLDKSEFLVATCCLYVYQDDFLSLVAFLTVGLCSFSEPATSFSFDKLTRLHCTAESRCSFHFIYLHQLDYPILISCC